MKPLDQVIRDRVWPTLKAAGFKRTTGRQFTLENEQGNRAVVLVHAFRLGRHDTEFFVELFLQPLIWRDWLISRDGGPYVHGGLVQQRLDPGGDRFERMRSGTLWSIDLDDDVAGSHLTKTLQAALPDLVELLDTSNLVTYTPKIGERGTIGLPEMPLAMLGPSPQLDRAFAELEARERIEGFDHTGYMRFLRGWVEEHHVGKPPDHTAG